MRETEGPAPEQESVGRHYRGGLGEQYFAWQRQGAELAAQLELAKFVGHVTPGDVVADFGCGTGRLLELLPARERLGIEPNPAARGDAVARGLRVVARTRELPAGSVDVVVSNHALEHVLRPVDELRDLLHVLRPGGSLVIYLPLDDWRAQRVPDPTDVNHHLYTWTPVLLANLLSEAGLEVRAVRVVTYAWPQFHEHLFRVLPRRAFDVLCRGWAVARRRRQLMAIAGRPAG